MRTFLMISAGIAIGLMVAGFGFHLLGEAASTSVVETMDQPSDDVQKQAEDHLQISQISNRCSTTSGICWVTGQAIGSPCTCPNGTTGTIIPN